jgi:hypothetical protein
MVTLGITRAESDHMNQHSDSELAAVTSESLETCGGGLSPELAQRAHAIASERYIDALNAGSPRANKLARQIQVFGNYGK